MSDKEKSSTRDEIYERPPDYRQNVILEELEKPKKLDKQGTSKLPQFLMGSGISCIVGGFVAGTLIANPVGAGLALGFLVVVGILQVFGSFFVRDQSSSATMSKIYYAGGKNTPDKTASNREQDLSVTPTQQCRSSRGIPHDERSDRRVPQGRVAALSKPREGPSKDNPSQHDEPHR